MPRGEKIVVVAGHFACVPVLVSLHGLWSGNETSCTHAYKISKWRPKQRTAATECCEWLLSTRVNFEAMKTLSGWEAACYDEHQFRATIKVSA